MSLLYLLSRLEGRRVKLEWDLNRLFDHEVAIVFEKVIKAQKQAT